MSVITNFKSNFSDKLISNDQLLNLKGGKKKDKEKVTGIERGMMNGNGNAYGNENGDKCPPPSS